MPGAKLGPLHGLPYVIVTTLEMGVEGKNEGDFDLLLQWTNLKPRKTE